MKSVGIKWESREGSQASWQAGSMQHAVSGILLIRSVAPVQRACRNVNSRRQNLITKQEILAHIVKANKTNEQEILIWQNRNTQRRQLENPQTAKAAK